jgi:Ca2+/H+ antiporter, TMEM165/GDT1 family
VDFGPWAVAAPAVGAAFVASLVEVVEAFTIVLAVATLRGRRPAVMGTLCALVVLGLLIILLGPVLDRVPLRLLQLFIGVLLLVFGLGWLRKAILRAAGIIPLHDEDAVFASESAQLTESARRHTSLDWIAGLTAFKAVLLEGLEVVFIVIAVGAGRGLLWPAAVGALAACAAVLCVGVIVHRPLARIPENSLKFGVGCVLSAFGLFWTGEGLGVQWPGQDLALAMFVGLFVAVGLATALLLRRQPLEAR